jgi:hypothetical protein
MTVFIILQAEPMKNLRHHLKTFKLALIILPGLPKMNIPQIPDIEEIKRKMAEANMNFPEPISYPDQLQAIRDLPPMNQMPTREEIQAAMQNMPTPIGANITQNPFQKIKTYCLNPIDQFQSFASKCKSFCASLNK